MRDPNSRMRLAGLVLLIMGAAQALAQQTPTVPVGAAGPAEAQGGAHPQTPQAQHPTAVDELEPAVNTSATAPQSPPPAQATAGATASSPPASSSPPAGTKTQDTAPTNPTAAKAPAARGKSGKASDRIELDTTSITGNRELPKVLYIVPWKRSDLGDLTGKPVNSLLDDVLQPVDRDVFKRENRYYRAVATPGSGAGDAGAAAAPAANRDADQGHGSSAPPPK